MVKIFTFKKFYLIFKDICSKIYLEVTYGKTRYDDS